MFLTFFLMLLDFVYLINECHITKSPAECLLVLIHDRRTPKKSSFCGFNVKKISALGNLLPTCDVFYVSRYFHLKVISYVTIFLPP